MLSLFKCLKYINTLDIASLQQRNTMSYMSTSPSESYYTTIDFDFELYRYNKIHEIDPYFERIKDIYQPVYQPTSTTKDIYNSIAQIKNTSPGNNYTVISSVITAIQCKYWDSFKMMILGKDPVIIYKPTKINLVLPREYYKQSSNIKNLVKQQYKIRDGDIQITYVL